VKKALDNVGGVMSQVPSDDELRALIPALSRVTGLPIAEERVEVVLPVYRGFLLNVERLYELPVPVEVEPAIGFDLTRGETA
jgi:hypothetical protein